MPLDVVRKVAQYKVPNLPEAGPNVFFADILGTRSLTGSLFVLEGPEPSTPPKYTYDETGVLLEGELNIQDEKGYKVSVKPGDMFFIHSGSSITFSTATFALAYKTAARPHSKFESSGKL